MPDFVKTNKIAFSFLLIFICLAAVSGFYLKSKPRIDEAVKVAAEPATEFLPKIISPGQILIAAPKPSSQPAKEAATAIRDEVPTSTSAIPATIGESHILIAGDKQYAISLPAGKTVYELMLALKNRGDFDFKGKGSAGLGFFVEEINGVKNNSFKNIFWFYYINGGSAKVGVSNYILKPNDLISWKYETAKF